MASEQEILAKYGVPSNDDAILAKYGVGKPDETKFNPSPLASGGAALAPKGLISSLYGAKEAISAPWGKKMDTYRRERDTGRQALEESEKINPKSAAIGNLTSGLLTGAAVGPSIPAMAALGGAYAGIESKADLTKLDEPEQRQQFGRDVGFGTAGAGLLGAAAEYIPSTVAGGLKDMAGKLAEKATGATRTMAEKFAPGAGKKLLEKGIVKFGYSPKNIANAAEKEMGVSQQAISSILNDLDKQGVKATPEEIAKALDQKIAALNELPGTMPQARKLEGLKEDIMVAMKNESQPLSQIEKYKRSYGDADWTDPEKAMAQKGAYRTLMETVENKATAASPELAGDFKNAKESYGLLAPIEEASQKRAIQLNQSPVGGLLDMASMVAGMESDKERGSTGLLRGAAFPIARRLLAPRTASMGAVSANVAAKILESLSPSARAAIMGSILSNRSQHGSKP